MHLVGFTIEIYCDARSYKSQTNVTISHSTVVTWFARVLLQTPNPVAFIAARNSAPA